jgi:hypothetical protein
MLRVVVGFVDAGAGCGFRDGATRAAIDGRHRLAGRVASFTAAALRGAPRSAGYLPGVTWVR